MKSQTCCVKMNRWQVVFSCPAQKICIKKSPARYFLSSNLQTKKLTFRGAQVNPRPLSSKTLASILFLKLLTEKASKCKPRHLKPNQKKLRKGRWRGAT
ncbi:hypothetical protein HanIR_Chr10g0451501 [Helianthus annuus]|nr:hypothetical protein HanIR_Chr10g0451501 [Helianthus annuus]